MDCSLIYILFLPGEIHVELLPCRTIRMLEYLCNVSWDFFAWRISTSPVIYVFSSLCEHGRTYILGNRPTLFCLSNCPSFGHWELLSLAPVFLLYTLISVHMCVSERETVCKCVCSGWREGSVLLSGNTRCFRFILYIYYLNPRISHFYKEPWFLLL